jgi:hypothetical protein
MIARCGLRTPARAETGNRHLAPVLYRYDGG